MSTKQSSAPAILPHQLAALRKLARDPAHPIEAGTLGMLRRRGLVGRVVENRGVRGRQRTTSPLTPAGRALLDSFTPMVSNTAVQRIAAALADLGYEGVRTTLDAVEVRGHLYPVSAEDEGAEVLRIVTALSGADAAAMANAGRLPVWCVHFTALDDCDHDDRGREVPIRYTREWPAVSAERARAEAEAWGAGDGAARVDDVEETWPVGATKGETV